MSEDIVAMARAAQRDERLSDGPLYGKLADEIVRLREQLHLANIDAIGANAEANDLRDRVSTLSELLSEYMRACGSLVSPRIEKKAIAALEAKP